MPIHWSSIKKLLSKEEDFNMGIKCNKFNFQESSESLLYLHKEKSQWRETPQKRIEYAPKEETILLSGGLTILQDRLIESALKSLGENYISMPNPDFEAFQKGKAYGNRGQCNPTYFTVGNLIKYLQNLQTQ